jgi:glycosyltransferase involved in cell wall biosynthesis
LSGNYDYIDVPEGAISKLRRKFRVQDDEKLRLSYLSLADDVARVQNLWVNGETDFAAIRQSHSALFFELVEKLDAEGVLFSLADTAALDGQRVRVEKLTRYTNRGYYEDQKCLTDMITRLDQFKPHAVVISQSLPDWVFKEISRRYPALFYMASRFWLDDADHARGFAGLKHSIGVHRKRRSLQHCKGVVAGVETDRSEVELLMGKGMPFEVEIPQFFPLPANRERSQARRILAFGPISQQSDIYELVDAFPGLRNTYADAELTIAGYGPAAEAMKERIKASEGMTFAGQLGYKGFVRQLEWADLCVIFEGGARSAPELRGLAAPLVGVPLLRHAQTPTLEELRPKTLVDAGGAQDGLVDAIMRLVKDDAAYQAALTGLPVSDASFRDPSQSWGSAVLRLLLNMKV